jgi:hypothetical protein
MAFNVLYAVATMLGRACGASQPELHSIWYAVARMLERAYGASASLNCNAVARM